MNKKALIGIAVVVLVAAMFLIIRGNRESEIYQIRIGYLGLTANLPLFVALENGYFDEVGLDIKTVRFETSNQMVDALVTGRIDVETAASSSVVVTVAQTINEQIYVFMLNAFTPDDFLSSILVKNGSGLDSIQNLQGKKVGTFPGSTMRVYTELLFKKFGIQPFEIIQLTPATQLGALENGSVDALVTLEPLGTLGEIKGIATRIEKGPIEKHVLNPWVAGTHSFSGSFLREHSAEAQLIQEALYKAVDYILDQPDLAKEAMLPYTAVTNESLAKKLTLPNYWKRSEMNISDFQQMADTLLENGIIDKRVDVSELIISE